MGKGGVDLGKERKLVEETTAKADELVKTAVEKPAPPAGGGK